MTTATATLRRTVTAVPDYAAIKQRQQGTWAAGDYAVIGTTLQIVGERLCEAIDLRAGERVLDVAAGNGNATLAAARRFAEVTSTDYVGALLERGKERAAAERLPVTFQVADAEALPFGDGSFDVALSTFGVMFTAGPGDLRGGAIARGAPRRPHWLRQLDAGRLHRPAVQDYRQACAAARRHQVARRRGVPRRDSRELFPRDEVKASRQIFNFRYKSPAHWLEVFKSFYGPMNRAFAALDAGKQAELQADVIALLGRMNRGGTETLIVPSEYLEVVVTKH